MELSRASIEQIVEELAQRPMEFSLVIRTESSESEDADLPGYQVYGNQELQGEPSLMQAVRCLMGGMHVLTGLSEEFEELEDFDKSHDIFRWVAVLELLLNDLFQTTEDWPELTDSSDNSDAEDEAPVG